MDTKFHFCETNFLLERLVEAAKNKERRAAFRFGSAPTARTGNGPGVPNVAGIVRVVAEASEVPKVIFIEMSSDPKSLLPARLVIEDALTYLASPEDPDLQSTVVEAAMDAQALFSTVGAGSEAPARLATGVAAEAALAVISLYEEGDKFPSHVHAAKAVHMAYRVMGDDQIGVWNWIFARLWHLANDQP